MSLWELNEVLPVVHLAQCMACNRCLVSGSAHGRCLVNGSALAEEGEQARWSIGSMSKLRAQSLQAQTFIQNMFTPVWDTILNTCGFCLLCCSPSLWILRSGQETGGDMLSRQKREPVSWHNQCVISRRMYHVAPWLVLVTPLVSCLKQLPPQSSQILLSVIHK